MRWENFELIPNWERTLSAIKGANLRRHRSLTISFTRPHVAIWDDPSDPEIAQQIPHAT